MDFLEVFLLGFENMNCFSGLRKSPSRAVGLKPVIFILPSLVCKRDTVCLFFLSVLFEEMRQRLANQHQLILNRAGVHVVL